MYAAWNEMCARYNSLSQDSACKYTVEICHLQKRLKQPILPLKATLIVYKPESPFGANEFSVLPEQT